MKNAELEARLERCQQAQAKLERECARLRERCQAAEAQAIRVPILERSLSYVLAGGSADCRDGITQLERGITRMEELEREADKRTASLRFIYQTWETLPWGASSEKDFASLKVFFAKESV